MVSGILCTKYQGFYAEGIRGTMHKVSAVLCRGYQRYYAEGIRGTMQRVSRGKAAEDDYLSPSSSEVMNGGTVPPVPHGSLWLTN
jgi:hypothetical protein